MVYVNHDRFFFRKTNEQTETSSGIPATSIPLLKRISK